MAELGRNQIRAVQTLMDPDSGDVQVVVWWGNGSGVYRTDSPGVFTVAAGDLDGYDATPDFETGYDDSLTALTAAGQVMTADSLGTRFGFE